MHCGSVDAPDLYLHEIPTRYPGLMKTLLRVISAFFALVLVLLVWGVAIEPRFLLDVQEHRAEIPNLPSEWAGEKVAFLADFQVGMWWDNTGMVEKAVEAAIEAAPAVILIGGDFVYKPDSTVIREAVSLMAPLGASGIPVFAVLGNHDYSIDKRDSESREALARFLEEELEAAGIEVLHNEARAVDGPGAAPLFVVGVGSEWAGKSQPVDAVAGVPNAAPRVLIAHNPVIFRDLPAHSAALAIAGHTHGGQVRLPFTPSESWLDIARSREVVADGWAADTIGAAGNRLYVSRGIGFSNVPVRIFCRPELSIFTLQPSDGTLPERSPGS